MDALPSVDSLRCFVAAARSLHFRRAAKSVFLTPQAFGQRIRQLEEGLGHRLFVRTTRSVQLTAEGLKLLGAAEEALGALARCVEVVKPGAATPQTSLVLGTRHELGLSWIEPELSRLRTKLPWLDLQLYFGSGADLLSRVRSLEVDCAVTSSRLGDPKLDAFPLHREDYVLVGSARLVAERPLSKPEHAAEHVLLDIDDSLALYRYWRDAPGAPELRFRKLARYGTIEALRRRVLARDGVAVLPLYLVRRDLKARALVRLFPRVEPLHDYFRLVFRSDDSRRSLYEQLAQALKAVPLR